MFSMKATLYIIYETCGYLFLIFNFHYYYIIHILPPLVC